MGLKPTIRRVWSFRGERPLAINDHRYEWLYVFSFVHPSTGQTEWFLMPTVNGKVMSAVLLEFAKTVGVGEKKQILLLVDQAGWHSGKDLVIPEGIHIKPLLSRTPELQPAEKLYPPLREEVANKAPKNIMELWDMTGKRCIELSEQEEFISGLTCFHWWPEPSVFPEVEKKRLKKACKAKKAKEEKLEKFRLVS